MTALQKAKAAPVGRPRILTREAVLDAAIRVGLEGLTLKGLANELNVGTTTLYQYFDGREDLVQAAAVHALSEVPWPKDSGQHWAAYTYDYIRVIITSLSENPTFIINDQRDKYGMEIRFHMVEEFLQVMNRRGFSPEDGVALFNLLSMVAISGAVESARRRRFTNGDSSLRQTSQDTMAKFDHSEFPLLRQVLDRYTASAEEMVDDMIFSFLTSFAHQRGEDISAELTKLKRMSQNQEKIK